MQSAPIVVATSFFAYWKELLFLFAAYGVVWATITRILFDSLLVASLARCKAQVVDLLNAWYAPRMAKVDSAVSQVDANTAQIKLFQNSMLDQNRELRERSDQQHAQNLKASAAITETLAAVQVEVSAMGKSMIEVQTYLTTRDGSGPFGTRAGDIPAPRVRKRRGE